MFDSTTAATPSANNVNGTSGVTQPDQTADPTQPKKKPLRPADGLICTPDPDRLRRPPKIGLGRVSKPVTPAVTPPATGERYDAYAGALFQIPGTTYRIAVCQEGRQWILQQREAKDHWL